MQIAHHLSELWKKQKRVLFYETPCSSSNHHSCIHSTYTVHKTRKKVGAKCQQDKLHPFSYYFKYNMAVWLFVEWQLVTQLATWSTTADLVLDRQCQLPNWRFPSIRTTFDDQSFAIDGQCVWNSLPASTRNPSLSHTVFTNRLKTHLFKQ